MELLLSDMPVMLSICVCVMHTVFQMFLTDLYTTASALWFASSKPAAVGLCSSLLK